MEGEPQPGENEGPEQQVEVARAGEDGPPLPAAVLVDDPVGAGVEAPHELTAPLCSRRGREHRVGDRLSAVVVGPETARRAASAAMPVPAQAPEFIVTTRTPSRAADEASR